MDMSVWDLLGAVLVFFMLNLQTADYSSRKSLVQCLVLRYF